MIKFFGKIRILLLSENRFGKYIFYAVGEVVLVVIGILIALQINNWNEIQKQRKVEIEILKEIRANLISDLKDHDDNMYFIEKRIRTSNKLIQNLKLDIYFNDSLLNDLWWISMSAPHMSPIVTGYNRMLSIGQDIIENDSIRSEISLIYENHYKWLKITFDEFYKNQTAWLNRDFTNNFIMPDDDSAFMIFEPKDFQNLKKNKSFITALTYHTKHWESVLERYEYYMEEFNKTIASIGVEIKRLEK